MLAVTFVLGHPATQQIGVNAVIQGNRGHGYARLLADGHQLCLELGCVYASTTTRWLRKSLVSTHVSAPFVNGLVCSNKYRPASMCLYRMDTKETRLWPISCPFRSSMSIHSIAKAAVQLAALNGQGGFISGQCCKRCDGVI